MRTIKNPYRTSALPAEIANISLELPRDDSDVVRLFSMCPIYRQSPLVELPRAAVDLRVASVFVKDERHRLGMPSLNSLGIIHALAQQAYALDGEKAGPNTLLGKTFVTAEHDNSGVSLAKGARVFGASAVVYITTRTSLKTREALYQAGAHVVVAGDNVEDCIEAARLKAKKNNWRVMDDGAWVGGEASTANMAEGYYIVSHEVAAQISQPPTHFFIQAGTGVVAASLARQFRVKWGEDFTICVVEPTEAPGLMDSIIAAKPTIPFGGESIMSNLNCKAPSLIALKSLARDADYFITVKDEYVRELMPKFDAYQMPCTPSGAAGYAGAYYARQSDNCRLNEESRLLVIVTEEA